MRAQRWLIRFHTELVSMIDVNEFWGLRDLLRLHIGTEVGKVEPFSGIWQCLVIEDEPGYH